ncbi:MAG: alpha/beta hydrolase [Alphaproteobacteria bacterium]|nr:alpha/beta hydrolase [Alphaproteobacteria bacterium]
MILLLSGCLTLDFMFFDTRPVDAYTIENDLVPAERIEPVTFESTDGTRLQGVWAHQAEPGRPVAIYFHGTSSNIETDWERVEFYWTWGYEVFVFDYRGYGASEGEASAAGVLEEDGLAAVRYVSETTGLAPEDIVWVCLSLGAAVATHTSDEIGAKAIVLQSMFASADEIIDDATMLDLPAGWVFASPDLDNVAAIPHVTAPVLIVHGLADDFIDPASGPELYEAAPEPKALWQPEGVGHADVHELLPEEFTRRALEFIAAQAED